MVPCGNGGMAPGSGGGGIGNIWHTEHMHCCRADDDDDNWSTGFDGTSFLTDDETEPASPDDCEDVVLLLFDDGL